MKLMYLWHRLFGCPPPKEAIPELSSGIWYRVRCRCGKWRYDIQFGSRAQTTPWPIHGMINIIA